MKKNKSFFFLLFFVWIIVVVLIEFIDVNIFCDVTYDAKIKRIISYALLLPAVIVLIRLSGFRVFNKIQCITWFFVSLIIAVNNFPFTQAISGNVSIVNGGFWRVAVFTVDCIMVAAIEELIFRGLIFNLILDESSKDKKGFIKAIIVSSVIFGLSHLLNLFGGASLLPTIAQAGYTSVIGALCAFLLFKTHNVIFPWIFHAVYNFCGTILTVSGIGSGFVLDLPTVIITALIALVIGVLVLFSVIKTAPSNFGSYAEMCLSKKKREE